MSGIVAKKAIAILIFLSLFSSCGELETLLPSSGSYQVRTLVNGRSLEDCSIIRADDKIRPYFTASVIGDPDLIGMLVYLQNSQGEIIGDKVRYILEQYADGLSGKTGSWEEASSYKAEESKTEVDKTEVDNIDETETTSEEGANAGTEMLENGTAGESRSFAGKETAIVSTGANVEIVVKSLDQELPYFPLPKNLEAGAYTLVFEALGKRETLSRMETYIFYLGGAEFNLKDVSIYLSGLSGSQLISPGTAVMLEAGLDFDRRLDPYVIWYNGKRVISEGKISEGAGTILWEAPAQAGFYSLRVEVLPFRLNRNLTGLAREITLPVSPKAISLGYFFENDPTLTGRSPLAAGTVYPEQVRLIKAMAASIDEENSDEKEMPVMPLAPEPLRWYQFEGNLRDSRSPLPHELSLASAVGKAPHWAATGQSYGLSIESDDAYQLSPINFFRNKKDQGGGIFLLHVRPPAEGTVLSAFFPSQSSSANGVWMDMIKGKDIIMLRLSNGNAAVELPLYLAAYEAQRLVPIVVEFYIRPYRLEAKISLNGEYPQNRVGGIKLPDALTGEGRIKLGGPYQNNAALRGINSIPDTNRPALTDTPKNNLMQMMPGSASLSGETPDSAGEIFILPEENTGFSAIVESASEAAFYENAIWDELAILISSVPLLEEEIFTEDIAAEPQAAAFDDMASKITSLKKEIPEPGFSAGSYSVGINNAAKKGDRDMVLLVADTYTDDSSPENY